MTTTNPNRLLPVLAALIGLIAGTVLLETVARGWRVPPLVIAVESGGNGGFGPELGRTDDEEAEPPVQESTRDDLHIRARELLLRGELDSGLAMLEEVIGEHPDEPSLRAELGYWLLVSRRPRDAVAVLEEAHREVPDHAGTALNLGIAYRRSGELADAERILRQLVLQYPAYRAAKVALGVALRRQERLDEAVAILEGSTTYGGNEERAYAFLHLGRAYYAAGRRVDARQAFETAIEWAPAHPDIRLGATWAYLQSKDTADLAIALDFLEGARRIAPDLAEVHSATGVARELEGRLLEAEDAYIRALRLDPVYHAARRRLIRLYIEREDLSQARAQTEELLRLEPDRPDHHFLAGLVAARAEEYEAARASYHRAIELAGNDYPEAWFNLGIAARNAGDTEESIRAYQEAIRLRPDYVEAMNNLGLVYSGSGRNEEARATFEQAVRAAPEHAQTWYHLGKMFMEQGGYQAAISAFQKARAARPGYRQAMLNQAVAHSRADELEKAIALYQEVTRLHPRYVRAFYNLSVALDRAGWDEEAFQTVKEAVAIDPGHPLALVKLARMEAARGELSSAIQHYQELLDSKPDHHLARVEQADVYRRTGDYEKCMARASTVLEAKPRLRRARQLVRVCEIEAQEHQP